MMDDPRHKQIRRRAHAPVVAAGAGSARDAAAARTAVIVDARRRAASGVCDLVVDIAAELPLQAIAHLLGVPQDDRHLLFGWANATLDHDGRELGEDTATTR